MEKHKIAADLVDLAYPIDKLRTLPGNYNKGNVPGVRRSYDKFGQRKPIVARTVEEGSDVGLILAGNTQYQAAKEEGWTHIAVSWVEDEEGWDDAMASAFAVADNELGKQSEEDLELKMEMIEAFENDFELMDAASLDLAVLQEMEEQMEADVITETDSEDDDGDTETDPRDDLPSVSEPRMVVQTTIVFDDETQQQRWYKFVRWLRKEYPDGETVAARLNEYLKDNFDD